MIGSKSFFFFKVPFFALHTKRKRCGQMGPTPCYSQPSSPRFRPVAPFFFLQPAFLFIHAQMGRPLQQSLNVEWRIKLQTVLYTDANTRHQMASICRSWMMTPSNGSRPHVPTSCLDGFGLQEENFLLHKLHKRF